MPTVRVKSIDPAKRYLKRRQGVLRDALKKHQADALLVNNPIDIRYLTGLTEGSHAVVIGADYSVVFTRAMFRDTAPKESPGSDVIIMMQPEQDEINALIKARKIKKLGFQEDVVTHARYRWLAEHLGERKLVPTSGLVINYRAIKDEDEIKITRKCVKIAEKAFKQMIGQGADHFIGKTEKQIAGELEYRMRQLGADRQGFGTNGIIVAAAANSAACHHVPTNRKIKEGQALLIDWGAELNGYRSDLTRTLFMKRVPEIYQTIYPVVNQALDAALAKVKPGVTGKTLDKIARDRITEAGYGDDFKHSLGHGIGLQIHEQPGLHRMGGKLKKNMIVTLEPGIYLDDLAGCRIEDDVLVTAQGAENLTTLTRNFKKMILA